MFAGQPVLTCYLTHLTCPSWYLYIYQIHLTRHVLCITGAGWNSWLSKCWQVIFNQSFTETAYVPSSSKTRCHKSIKVGCVFLFICFYDHLYVTNFFFSFHDFGKRWVRFGSDLELLDSPGIIPMRMSDQSAAIKLAICDDIGEKSYDFTDVAGVLVQMLSRLPAASMILFLLFP